MRRSKLIQGFDETTGKLVEATFEEWQARIGAAIRAGGWRRFEKGETYIHGPDALLIAEVFANVPAPTGVEAPRKKT